MKVLNLGIVVSEKILYSTNAKNNDIMKLAIAGGSKECVNILTDIANYTIDKSHLVFAKKRAGQKSPIYNSLKWKVMEQNKENTNKESM